MNYSLPLRPARLVRRYKRFLADMDFGGETVTVHCPNTGAMLGCDTPGSACWLSHSDNPRRKYAWTWELATAEGGALVGIHTGRTNALVRDALEHGGIAGLTALEVIRGEYRPAGASSRFDLLARDGDGRRVIVEVKSVTAVAAPGEGIFPDAVSTRARRHVAELAGLLADDTRCVLVLCAQRGDVERIRAAGEIDPAYAEALDTAVAAGVEVAALGCRVAPEGIRVERAVAFEGGAG